LESHFVLLFHRWSPAGCTISCPRSTAAARSGLDQGSRAGLSLDGVGLAEVGAFGAVCFWDGKTKNWTFAW